MSEGYVDLSPIVRNINALADTVNRVGNAVVSLDNRFTSEMAIVKQDLDNLRKGFITMMEENRRAAALQRAITEIIRVRQELERDYGNYKIVRNTMLGILEATDLKLIRQTTIKTCTEELMLSTPRYWLAPVLIALSAWIANDKPLATRALKEALRRDEEKTCLVFALVCRRNQRTTACFEWLSRYFAKQKANDMQESIIAYINAYTNGVFGVDPNNLCEEYISHWMNELQSTNPNFEQEQVDYWKRVYATYCKDTTGQYPVLAEVAKPEFARINEYLMRVNATPEIIAFFSNILNTEVDREALATAIDNELIKLVKNYDKDEAPLREEEEYLNDVKTSNGNEEWAKKRQALRRAQRADRKVDFAEQLSKAILAPTNENVSAKKTAIRFMNGYIKGAFKQFIEEKAPAYPEEITINTFAWKGTTKDGSNQAELIKSYEKEINGRREKELTDLKAKNKKKMIAFFSVAGVFAVLALIGMIVGIAAAPAMWALFAIGLLLGVIFLVLAFRVKSFIKTKTAEINGRYDNMLKAGAQKIIAAIKEYVAANAIVHGFDAVASSERLLLGQNEEEETEEQAEAEEGDVDLEAAFADVTETTATEETDNG